MAKWQNDLVLDQALNYIRTQGTEMYVCSAQPTDRATAISTSLTSVAVPGYDANANGDVSGRKIRVQQEADIPITASGDATHIAICSGTALIYVTTCTTQSLGSGGTVTVPAWDIEFADAS